MTAAAAAASGGGGIVQTEPCCVAAIIFNNAKEVGVALCELPSLTISLLQFADTAVFFKTTSLLHSRNPVEVLVPSTVVDTELVQTLLRQHGAHMTFTSVQRCFYHTEAGVQRLSQLKSSEEAALCIEDTDRYLCVAAANALVLYMEHVNDMQLLPGSVRVRAEALEHFMEVTRTTARALQIIADGSGTVGVLSSSASSSHVLTNDDAQDVSQSGQRMDAPSTSRRRPRSARAAAATPSLRSGAVEGTSTTLRAAALVDVVPRACTIMGQRYLRRALLQPLRDRIAVQGRHDTVEWLLRDPRRLHVLRALLRRTAALDLERLTATLTLQPRRERTDAQKQSYLESLLLLWSALPYLERLHTQLRAHLGPPPTDATPTIHFPSSPSTPSDTKEQQQPQQQQSRETDESLSRVKEPVTVASTPVYPSVLHSVATTLHQCRFTELAALMGRYLERSVLPSVVEHNERGRATDLQNAGAEMPFFFEQGRRHGTSASLVNGVAQRRPPPTPRAATTTLLRVLRMCFLVQAPPGGELDALRTRLSQRITGITAYAEELRRRYQLYSLRLEPDPVKLYCFSYLSTEESKAQAVPFTWRYAGGSHFALLLAALRQQQQQQQRLEAHGGVFSENDEDDDEATEEFGDTISRRARQSSARQASSSSAMTGVSLRMLTGRRDNRLAARRAAVTPAYSPTRPPPLAPSWSAEPSLYPTESCGEGSWNALAPCNSQSDGRRGRRHGRRVRCGTEELEYYGARMQECVAAILVQQMRCVQPLVQALRQRFLSALQATVESVALLDTLLSFALYSLTHHCTRPVMVELKTGLTTAASDAHVCETSLSDEEAEVKRRDRDEDPFVVSENPDGSTSLNATATTSPSASPKSTASCSARLASAMMSDDVADTKRKSSQGLAFFIKDAFHPSAGVTGASLGRSNQQSLPRYPGGVATHLQDAPVATPMCVGGGLSLSWGTHGEVCIITGPNACGKTTLLRILGQHITLAQAGCFVPARQARIFLADRLLAHMLCEELPSVLHSSFKRELMELNELTHAATEESMVLMDELGRSTTTAQGFSLAWATALFLGHRHVHAVLTTHFAGLPSLTRVRPGRVVAFHFRVSLAQVEMRTGRKWQQRPPTEEANHAPERASRAARCSLARPRATTAATTAAATPGPRITIARFGHELFPGPCPQRWYGLAMAERLGFFEPVLTMARQTRACHREVSEGAMGAHDAEGDRVKE
ncbi:putative DNA mismatch repair protein MSH4 [Leptomonas pyrrhocoris]|uniref:Putative DNA mismatch repair protein MSH4 n=1 Tax=Leptomonas pyrrhocoris TaxID=157538 RepID=A0A0M9FXR0_LEPPY|nr:putative DNA mismatch repair protein MSH4 [Leptomonas pyrrhocoris]KPA78245.1 putative DNA mismatch repair protein MSH4 [Leptomonas pyrrhocoris]|eukprot:XP_015656684.1 putative DNA mismatch repair protein MSH4 [Leptomonas pyrrhocoris]